jgi:hypothetical protein
MNRIKAALSLVYAKQQMLKRKRWLKEPLETQVKWQNYLIGNGRKTKFGADHKLEQVFSYEQWKTNVPIQDYEGLSPYIDSIRKGEPDVLWPGKPLYLAKTSGTTSGSKYIPLTDSMPFHIRSAKMSLLSYIDETEDSRFVEGKMLFLQGSPALHDEHGLQVGRLSGITAHHVPGYLQRNRVPIMATNLIEDWEQKVDAIVAETCKQDLRLISGIPSWLQMYFERLLAHTGAKTVLEVFPNFSLMVHGGVNYRPYAARFKKLIGAEIPSIELYPASEGFIAYQDSQDEEGLLLELDSGMFYEFIPADEYFSESPSRVWLDQVELGINYALIISSSAGLWGYSIGDTIKFVCKAPYRIVVTGRIKHFTSAFGEHVIAKEVEQAMIRTSEVLGLSITEFHLAPQASPTEGLAYHEWFIESEDLDTSTAVVAQQLDREMCAQNTYYKDLISGKVLRSLIVRKVAKGGFQAMMESRGKLGGQNKVPRLSNDRDVAEVLSQYLA